MTVTFKSSLKVGHIAQEFSMARNFHGTLELKEIGDEFIRMLRAAGMPIAET
jgi:hypothetical protein